MELVSLAKEMLQNVAEHVASYRLGQTTLRYLDRVLWTVEKCARWAVPPPLDQDDRPQPELVRPLPWVFFLTLLVALRITRESISFVYLVLGKPPLRSADVVTYIQGKRRYLRTLKYQGSRMMRARSDTAPRQSWFSSLQSLLEFTMCFRRQPQHYGNNNTTRLSNNDEVLVVKRNKHGDRDVSPVASPTETTMERLIEKIMVDLDADSDEDDSSYTLTNVTSVKSDQSGYNTESDQDTAIHVESSTFDTTLHEAASRDSDVTDNTRTTNNRGAFTPDNSFDNTADGNITTSTPEKVNRTYEANNTYRSDEPLSNVHCDENGTETAKDVSIKLIQSEKSFSPNSHTSNKQKIANGRATSGPPNKESISNEVVN